MRITLSILLACVILGFTSGVPIYKEVEYDVPIPRAGKPRKEALIEMVGHRREEIDKKALDRSDEVERRTVAQMLENPLDPSDLDVSQRTPDPMPEKEAGGQARDMVHSRGTPAEDTLRGSPVYPPVTPQKYMRGDEGPMDDPRMNGADPYSQQKNAAAYGQQPQMDLKMPPQMEQASMMDKQNNDVIQNSIQDKLNFMDRATGGPGAGVPSPFGSNGLGPGPAGMGQGGMGQGMGGAGGEMMSSFAPGPKGDADNEGPHGVPSGQSGAVSDRDIMKAEGIQPNEMSDLNHFLETSNKVNSRSHEEAEMSDTKFIPSSEEQSPINSEADQGRYHEDGPGPNREEAFHHQGGDQEESHPEKFLQLPHADRGQNRPDDDGPREDERGEGEEHSSMQKGNRGPENEEDPDARSRAANTGVNDISDSMATKMVNQGPSADAVGSNPTIDFVEQNTRAMMEKNSDYRVPGSAFSNLWKDFMSSTQSQLGSKDPSANSRGEAEKMQPIEMEGSNFMNSAAAPPPERAPLMKEKKSYLQNPNVKSKKKSEGKPKKKKSIIVSKS